MPVLFPLPFALFVVGVFLSTHFAEASPMGWAAAGLAGAAGAAAGLAVCLFVRRRPSRLLLLALGLGLGLARGGGALAEQPEPWAQAPDKSIEVKGVIDAPVETRGSASTAEVVVEAIEGAAAGSPPGKVRLILPALPPVDLGDRVRVVGHFRPVDPASPSGPALLNRGVVAISAYPDVALVEPVDVGPGRMAIFSLRSSLERAVQRALPEPQAALLAGLLVGSTAGRPDELHQALVASGTSHLVVVSGYNISLIAAALYGLLRGYRWAGALAALLGVWTFTLVAGASPPSVRAAVMASVALLAVRTGRGADPLGALALTVAGMLALAPGLALELGFQLSALATLGIIALQPRVASLAPWMPRPVREAIASTFAAQLATIPVLASTFHQLSVVAPLSNLLAAPMVPVATIVGGVAAAVVALVPETGGLAGALLALPTGYLLQVIETTAGLPVATIALGDVPEAAALMYGGLLLAWAALPTPEGRAFLAAIGSRPQVVAAGLAAALGGLGAILAWQLVPGSAPILSVSAFDTGGSHAFFIRTPQGHSVLVDGGRSPSALASQLGRRLGLLERHLTAGILTRADGDRLPGLVAAGERYPPLLALEPPGSPQSALHQRWRELTMGRSTLVEEPVVLGLEEGLRIELFLTGAVPGTSAPRALQRTLVARLVYGEVAFLLGPDLTAAAARALVDRGVDLKGDVLFVPRGAGADSLDGVSLAAISPRLAVVAVNGRNRAGLPAPETLALLRTIPTYRTDLHGPIEVTTDGRRIWIEAQGPGVEGQGLGVGG